MENRFPAAQLLKWFARAQRPLPWRKSYHAYEVWLSEIMAQQTRIEQMLPYYERFLQKFPNVKALADADPQEVLKMWEGLGYYSRARNLHHAAKQIVSEKKGIIPQKKEELMELKGFGPYISSAVASIAFNEDVPVVDGNVLRVATRFWGLEEDVSKPATRKKIEGLLTNSFPHGHARAFNQGLMELGALVCTPHSPSCGACPLQQGCYAFIHSRQEYYPVKGEKKKSPTKHFAMIVLQEKGKWGLIQRKTKLLHGMWEFPMVEYDPLTDTHSSIEKKFKDEGLDVRIGKGIGVVSHQYSHFNQEVQLFVPANADQTKVEWVSPAQLRTHPFSKVQQKVFDFLRESHIL